MYTEEYIRNNSNKVDWNYISLKQELSEELIRDFQNKVEKQDKSINIANDIKNTAEQIIVKNQDKSVNIANDIENTAEQIIVKNQDKSVNIVNEIENAAKQIVINRALNNVYDKIYSNLNNSNNIYIKSLSNLFNNNFGRGLISVLVGIVAEQFPQISENDQASSLTKAMRSHGFLLIGNTIFNSTFKELESIIPNK
jgi:hypothetical protein